MTRSVPGAEPVPRADRAEAAGRGAHDAGECTGCEWERQPQAYRWFPELGPPLEVSPPDGS